MARFIGHGIIVILLTALTQIGGAAWIFSRIVRRRRLLSFLGIYTIMSVAVTLIAPQFGRVRLPIASTSLHAASPIYWMLNRNFVVPELRDALFIMADP